MNREILFRGKRVDNGEWVEGNYLAIYTSGLPFSLIMGKNYDDEEKRITNHAAVISSTVGQYTGLTDKNGVKIFEGDIIEYQGKRYSINYLKHFARFSAVKPNTVFCVFAYQMGEVIGNIYDDPELMKGER